jgi:hypothetical protein
MFSFTPKMLIKTAVTRVAMMTAPTISIEKRRGRVPDARKVIFFSPQKIDDWRDSLGLTW